MVVGCISRRRTNEHTRGRESDYIRHARCLRYQRVASRCQSKQPRTHCGSSIRPRQLTRTLDSAGAGDNPKRHHNIGSGIAGRVGHLH